MAVESPSPSHGPAGTPTGFGQPDDRPLAEDDASRVDGHAGAASTTSTPSTTASTPDEANAIRVRYARRPAQDPRYSLFNPAAMAAMQERQRAIMRLLAAERLTDLPSLRLLEVGCGSGGNLLEFLRLGFSPANLVGIELLEDRHATARACLPPAVGLHLGDATGPAGARLPAAQFDIVYQATVFSSLLDDAFQQRLAERIWHWVRPGGGVLWYDFTVDNPRNPDVRGVGSGRVRELFPLARAQFRRITLAPPLARAVSRVHPGLYDICNALPPLRTHLLGWLAKSR